MFVCFRRPQTDSAAPSFESSPTELVQLHLLLLLLHYIVVLLIIIIIVIGEDSTNFNIKLLIGVNTNIMETAALSLARQAATTTPPTQVFSNDQQADTALLSDNLQTMGRLAGGGGKHVDVNERSRASSSSSSSMVGYSAAGGGLPPPPHWWVIVQLGGGLPPPPHWWVIVQPGAACRRPRIGGL